MEISDIIIKMADKISQIKFLRGIKNMWKVNEKEIVMDGKLVKTYGIKSENVEINDISTYKAEVEKFADVLNKQNASEIHVYDLINDFIER